MTFLPLIFWEYENSQYAMEKMAASGVQYISCACGKDPLHSMKL